MSTAMNTPGAEIICLDKATAWCGMDIGTAKPSSLDQQQVPHQLVDVLHMDNIDYRPAGRRYLNDIFGTYPDNLTGILCLEAQKHLARLRSVGSAAICVGGSGALYSSLYGGYTFPQTEPRYDARLRELSCIGARGMRAYLVARGIPLPFTPEDDRGNFDDAGVLFEQIVQAETQIRQNAGQQKAVVIGIDIDDKELKERIEARTADMLDRGLEDEVEYLVWRHAWRLPLRSTVGYKEFRGRVALEERFISQGRVEELINANTLQYARRQRAWCRARPEVRWVRNPEEATELALRALDVR